MIIRCPTCGKVSEIEHVERGRNIECVCRNRFMLDDSTVVEDYSRVDASPPEQIGPYRIERLIGRGGMGMVFKGIHPTLKIPVAVKTLLSEYADNSEFKERFIKSAKICAKLNHPNIVRVYDFGTDSSSNNLYLVLEYIGGGSCLDMLNNEGHLSPEKVAEIALAVCNGLSEAEKFGIVHRDIKPDNILRSADGEFKLSDLGLAKLHKKDNNQKKDGDPARKSDSSQTVDFTALGTLQYMSPEQAIDSKNCDIRADIYSLGITMYQLISGQLPFDSPDSAELRRMQLEQEAVVPSEIIPSIPMDMEYIIMRCIRKDKAERYQSPAELKNDLEAFLSREELLRQLEVVDDRRIWVIAEACHRGMSYDLIHDITKIDRWFIDKIAILVEMERRLISEPLTPGLLRKAKRIEFPDGVIARLTGKSEGFVKNMRHENGITASFKMVDTCAAEFEAATPYYYSCFDGENEARPDSGKKKILVLGSGPIRIGQGIEFDFCSVHCTWAFAKAGYETIIINNNPETVSTDFDIADKLYFEPLTPEDVENVVDVEKPDGAVVQFGGQTAIKLTEHLMKMGVPILGTKAEDVDAAEDRELFDQILQKTQIPRAAGGTVYTAQEAREVANRLGYPVLVRPSYVLGGQGMHIAFNDGKMAYAFLPVYLLSRTYKNKVYTFAINGQSGKVAGDLPYDYPKLFLYGALVFIVSFLLIGALAYFFLV